MKKFIKSSIVWLSQEYQEKPLAKTFGQFTNNKYRQQEKSRKQITYLDNKKIFGDGLSKNNQNKLITNPSKTNHKNSITFQDMLIDLQNF